MFVQQIKGAGADGKSHVKDTRLYAHGSSRISRPGGLNVCLESKHTFYLSVGGAELPNHSGSRPSSLKPWL